MNKLKDTDLREALRRNYAETPQLPEGFMERMHEAVEQEESQPRRTRRYRLTATITSIAAAILIAFLLSPESNKDTMTQQEMHPIVAEANSQPVPQPIVEEKKEETVMAVMQATPQPVKKRRKAVKKQSIPIEEPTLKETEQPIHERDIEPMYAQTEENVTPYHTMQTIHLSSDVVVYVIEASDVPDVSMMPSVSELRARGLRLTNYVRQATQTTVQF